MVSTRQNPPGGVPRKEGAGGFYTGKLFADKNIILICTGLHNCFKRF